MHERLVGGEQPVPAGEQIALEPALEGVLGEDLHDSAVGGEVPALVVAGQALGEPCLARDLEEGVELVGGGLVGPEDAEGPGIVAHDVAEPAAQGRGVHGAGGAGGLDGDGVGPVVSQPERPAQQPAVGLGPGAHARRARGGQHAQLRQQGSRPVEQFPGSVTRKPRLQLGEVRRIPSDARERNLVRPEGSLHGNTVDAAGPRPSLGAAEDDDRPAGPFGLARRADGGDAVEGGVEGGGHRLVHAFGFRALHQQRLVSQAREERDELGAGNPGQHGGVVDLVTIQMEDGQDGAVGGGVEEPPAVPRRRQRAGFRLPVANDDGGDQPRVVEHRPGGVGQAVAQFAPLVDAPGQFRRAVAAHPAGKAERAEELLHAADVLPAAGINLGIGALQVHRGDHPRGPVAGPGEEDHLLAALADDAVDVV